MGQSPSNQNTNNNNTSQRSGNSNNNNNNNQQQLQRNLSSSVGTRGGGGGGGGGPSSTNNNSNNNGNNHTNHADKLKEVKLISDSLYDAISAGEAAQVEFLLNSVKRYDINRPIGPHGHPPIHCAVHGTTNTCDLLQILEKRGANLNSLNVDGETPLIIAVSADREDVVNLLLKLGADVDIPATSGAVPLHYALTRRCRAVLPAILAKQPNVNFLTQEAESILHAAVKFGELELVNAAVNDLRVYYGGKVQFPPCHKKLIATQEVDEGNENNNNNEAVVAEDRNFRRWANTASLLDARSSVAGMNGVCPLGVAIQNAINPANSVAVGTKSTQVAYYLASVRTDLLMEEFLDLKRY